MVVNVDALSVATDKDVDVPFGEVVWCGLVLLVLWLYDVCKTLHHGGFIFGTANATAPPENDLCELCEGVDRHKVHIHLDDFTNVQYTVCFCCLLKKCTYFSGCPALSGHQVVWCPCAQHFLLNRMRAIDERDLETNTTGVQSLLLDDGRISSYECLQFAFAARAPTEAEIKKARSPTSRVQLEHRSGPKPSLTPGIPYAQ